MFMFHDIRAGGVEPPFRFVQYEYETFVCCYEYCSDEIG